MNKIRFNTLKFNSGRFVFILLVLVSGLVVAEVDNSEAAASEKMLAKSWWNQTRMVETLALKKSQRDKIDALALRYIQQKKQSQEKTKALQSAFITSLGQRDFSGATETIEAIAGHAALAGKLQRLLKVNVLAELEEPQFKLLAEEFPQIISRVWLSNQRTR